MKIAIVNDTVHPFFKGGAQKRVYEIARRLVKRGHDVHWYCMDYGVKNLDGIILHPVCKSYDLYNNEGRRKISQAIDFALKLNIKEKVDVIDCMNFPYLHCFRAKESAKRLKVPLIITWFEYWGDYWYEYLGKLGIIGKLIEKAVTHLPDMIIADSNKVKSQLPQSDKVRVVPDGVDTTVIASVTPCSQKFDVVYVGRLLAHKNVDILVKAVTTMRDVNMAVIGTGQSEQYCKEIAGNNIKFFGHIKDDEDVYAIMKSAKVLVLPSTQEGHPLVIPEANACGIPVIGIKGICDEFIKHNETGYLSLLDEVSLRLCIEKAIENYPRFKNACIKESLEYDWDNITSKVEAIYKELT